MDQAFRHLQMPPELACKFLAVFSRLEYALKASGYAVGNESRIDPAWDRFANEIDGTFANLQNEVVAEARNYLLSSPPRKQVLKDSRVIFQDQRIDENQRKAQQVLLMVRTVRNNLFHGGKHLPDGEKEPNRNFHLVDSALKVLEACSALNTEVRAAYEH